jgi:crotonobetainyl-CoA:carnitine CoA-transferase CaiB-like acyl-CoA transferase
MSKALEGIRIIDMTHNQAGPACAQILAFLGADVIKLEEPKGGDVARRNMRDRKDSDSLFFLLFNANKRSLTLNLKTGRGKELFKELIAKSDVLLENFGPGALDRLGFGYEALAKINPRLIYATIKGFGTYGPYRDYKSYEPIAQAMGGAMSITGEEGRPPVRMGLPMGDLAGGMFGALAVAGALLRRAETGEGTAIDLSLLDCQVSLLTYIAQYFWTNGRVPIPLGSGHASVVPYSALQTRDGNLIVAIFAEKFWGAFCRAVEHPEWERDLRFATNRDRVLHRDVLMPLVEAAFRTRTTADWLERLQKHSVPATPILTVDRVLSDPQVLQRGMVVTMDHPLYGKTRTLGTPVKMDGAMGLEVTPAPRLGQQTNEILTDMLKYSNVKIAELRATGAIA